MTKIVLFLCTGNYYRSRFCEILFNHLSEKAGIKWKAESRGIAVDLGANNIGPFSQYALTELSVRQISIPSSDIRTPRQASPSDLRDAGLVIALDESEHRPLLSDRFPGWEDRVRYWHVHDVGSLPASEGCMQMEKEITGLIDELSGKKA
jgi:protein-tyrosine phosphatase